MVGTSVDMATDHWAAREAAAVVRESFQSNDCGILGDVDRHVGCHVQVVPESWFIHYSDMFNDMDRHVISHV